jgi:hypothetical protein
VTKGSAVITSTAPGAFAARGVRDVVAGTGLTKGTVVLDKASNDQLTLSSPWTGVSGTAQLVIHHDLRNYAVHFSLTVK